MATIDYLELFNGTIAPGASIQSIVFGCSDARSVQVSLATGPLSDEVVWKVMFGPVGNGGYTAGRTGTFERYNHLGVEVPVFGPQVMVVVENQGSTPFPMTGMIRIVHEL